MFLATLLIWLIYKIQTSDNSKLRLFYAACIGVLAGISYGIRPPLIIYYIALFIVIVVVIIKNIKQFNFKKAIYLLSVGLFTFIFTFFGYHYSLNHQTYFNYDSSQSRTSLYFIDLGLTSTGAAHSELTEEVINASGDDRNSIFLSSIRDRLSHMTFITFVQHLARKYYLFTSEGMFGWQIEAVLSEENKLDNYFTNLKLSEKIREQVYVRSTNYFLYSYLMQIIWIITILGLFLYSFYFDVNGSSYDLWLQITIFGGLLFLLIFEGGRSRYLIQFLPAILFISSSGYYKFFSVAKSKNKKLDRLDPL